MTYLELFIVNIPVINLIFIWGTVVGHLEVGRGGGERGGGHPGRRAEDQRPSPPGRVRQRAQGQRAGDDAAHEEAHGERGQPGAVAHQTPLGHHGGLRGRGRKRQRLARGRQACTGHF